MKRIIIISIAIIYGLCATGQTIRLTDFTQSIIKDYMSQNVTSEHSGDIVINFSADSHHYYMSIFIDTIGYYDTAKANTMIFNGIELKISGIPIPFLFTGNLNMRHLKINQSNEVSTLNYDPVVWEIVFHKDGTLCKMFTQKAYSENSIDDIVDLSEQYLRGVSLNDYDMRYIYDNIDVDTPAKFQYGSNTLRGIMKSNVNIKSRALENSIPVVINLIIDKSGMAKVDKFTKKTKYKDVNQEALRIANIICSYNFIPAKHRGEFVSVNYSLLFPRYIFE